MTAAEKMTVSRQMAEFMTGRTARGEFSVPGVRCLYCGGEISEKRFLLIRCAGGYSLGCVDCGGARELVPSVNPFMFGGLARRVMN